MFNKYQWENYVRSGGSEIIKVFEDMLNFKNMEKYASTVRKLINNFCPYEPHGIELEKDLNEIITNPFLAQEGIFSCFEPNKQYTVQSALDALYENLCGTLKEDDVELSDSNILELFLNNME